MRIVIYSYYSTFMITLSGIRPWLASLALEYGTESQPLVSRQITLRTPLRLSTRGNDMTDKDKGTNPPVEGDEKPQGTAGFQVGEFGEHPTTSDHRTLVDALTEAFT